MKDGYKTTEFWIAIFVKLYAVFLAVQGFIPKELAVKVVLIMGAVYTLARTLIKVFTGQDEPDLPAA